MQSITTTWGLSWKVPINQLMIIILLVIIATYVSIIGPINKIGKVRLLLKNFLNIK